jgi:hypothetical protein
MFWSSMVSRPSTCAPGSTSCMRLIDRRNVDLPQPDGPMRAVIDLGSTVIEMLSIALNVP